MFARMNQAIALKTGRPLKALVVASALSLLVASVAHAGGVSGGVLGHAKSASGHHQPADRHSGGAATNSSRGGIGGEV